MVGIRVIENNTTYYNIQVITLIIVFIQSCMEICLITLKICLFLICMSEINFR
jgi:hypothetical protein